MTWNMTCVSQGETGSDSRKFKDTFREEVNIVASHLAALRVHGRVLGFVWEGWSSVWKCVHAYSVLPSSVSNRAVVFRGRSDGSGMAVWVGKGSLFSDP